jgi:hypothetical protein
MRVLFDNEYMDVVLDEIRAIARVRRKPHPYPDLDVAKVTLEGVREKLALLDAKRFALLIDLRDAPSRNDPEFEQAVANITRQVATFPRRATLVRTMAGKLQIQRLDRENRRAISGVFTDDDEAINYLRSS